ncbi:hypothetical protein BJ138DRAFT_980360, partial [Hygrophoropsis aurantiaca]
MIQDKEYQEQVFRWLEINIHCQLPGMSEVILDRPGDPLVKPRRPPDSVDPRLVEGPFVSYTDNDSEFERLMQLTVKELAEVCNWHKHTETCWKHLRNGEPRDDKHCRMRMDGTTRSITELDPATLSILLKRLHPWINNFNDLVIFLLRCNMDIKYIGSGEAAKALVFYITDYITKGTLPVHVGLDAVQYAIKQNDRKFSHQQHTTDKDEKAKSLFTKCVHAIMARQEMSHQQVMSYLIGGGDVYKSHLFSLLPWCDFDRHVRQYFGEARWLTRRGCYLVNEEVQEDHSNESDTEEFVVVMDQHRVSLTNALIDYQCRSLQKPFDDMCIWEFVSSTLKITESAETRRL